MNISILLRLEGEPFRTLAKRTGTSVRALFRHRPEHIPAALVKAKEATDQLEAATLFERLRALNRETQAILQEARESGNNELDAIEQRFLAAHEKKVNQGSVVDSETCRIDQCPT